MTSPDDQVDYEAEAAAWALLLMCSGSQRMGTKLSVLEALEREERVFIRVPRKKRSLRIPVDDILDDGPIAEPTTSRVTRSDNKQPRPRDLSPPTIQPRKKATISNNGRFQVGASSSAVTREPTPAWLQRLMADKNGENLKYIISKGLKASDVTSNNCRLSIPAKQIVDSKGFLSPAEESFLQSEKRSNGIRKQGVDTILVISDLREFELTLRLWDMSEKCEVYNLATKWNDVVKDYGLKEKTMIHLWSFHANGQLYFAMTSPVITMT